MTRLVVFSNERKNWRFTRNLVLSVLTVLLCGSGPPVLADEPEPVDGAGVGEFLSPEGRLDLEAVRQSGFQGSLDLSGFGVQIDPVTAEPTFSPDPEYGRGDEDGWWDGFGVGPNGTNFTVYAATVFQGDLYVGGKFIEAGGVATNYIARWDGSAWHALGLGVGGNDQYVCVYALAVYDDGNGPDLYVGGHFTWAGQIQAFNIARWSGSGWSAVNYGLHGSPQNGWVRALTVYHYGQFLVAGGSFYWAGPGTMLPVDHIAYWDGTNWNAMGPPAMAGFNQDVCALTEYDDELFAGGNFWQAGHPTYGAITVHKIARWNGSTWNQVGSPNTEGVWTGDDRDLFGGCVFALKPYDDGDGADLYVGGWFHKAGGNAACHIARWDGSAWSQVGPSGLDDRVYALAVFSDDLIAGGAFGDTWNSPSPALVARWDGSSWSGLGSGLSGGGSVKVCALTNYNDGNGNDLIVGGFFSLADGEVPVRNVAAWSDDKGSWETLAAEVGVEAPVSALTVYDDGNGADLYVGGWFTQVNDTPANRIARWDGSAWSAVGDGVNDGVRALTVYQGELIAGGDFTEADGGFVNNVARWNGSSWDSLGNGVYGTVYALAVYDELLFVGGDFSFPRGTNLSSWNGNEWWGFAHGTDDVVFALAAHGESLVAGGWFTTIAGVAAERIARWDGSSWNPLGTGMDGGVYAVTTYGGDLVAGGAFTEADGIPANCVARWDGVAWDALGEGIAGGNPEVHALTVYNDDLIAGGWFTEAGGKSANNIARWDGGGWSGLGGGTNDAVAVLVTHDGSLFAGGYFTEAGTRPSYYIARWDDPSGGLDNTDGDGPVVPQLVRRLSRWGEDFDSYEPGSGMHGQGGWKGWDNDPAFDAFVTDIQARSGPHSVDVADTSDLVHEFDVHTSGRWQFTAWQYIPADFSNDNGAPFDPGTYFLLLNTYADGGPYHWSVQFIFDSNDGMLKVNYGDGQNTIDVPYIIEAWIQIKAVIDLDNDWVQVFYDGAPVAEYSWTGGIYGDGGGAASIAAVDLFANGSSSVYYDDLSLKPARAP